MLVLSRRERETVVIGNIEVTILEINGNQVKLGIQAPRGVVIARKELLERKPTKRPDDNV